MGRFIIIITSFLIICLAGCQMTERTSKRCGFWVDAYRGEPVTYNEMMDDLLQVEVVYLGERHTFLRHHEIQHQIVTDLIANGRHIILGLEQIEDYQQPIVEQYNRGEITYEELARQISWSERWDNYLDYRSIVKTVHDAGGIITALNARREIVRKVARKGLENLSEEERKQLPAEIDTTDEQYRQYMNHTMMVMAHVKGAPEMLNRMFTAQVCRDEAMAENLFQAISVSDQQDITAVVICGSGHVRHRSGIPNRLKRRLTQIKDRVIVLSGSGDVVLSDKMKKMSRKIIIPHQKLRELDTPIADYLHVVNLRGELEIYIDNISHLESENNEK